MATRDDLHCAILIRATALLLPIATFGCAGDRVPGASSSADTTIGDATLAGTDDDATDWGTATDESTVTAEGSSGSDGTTDDGCVCDGDPPVAVPLTFTQLASSPDFRAPGRGAESWHGADEADVPIDGAPEQALDVYHRSWFTWARIEPALGEYDFSRIEEELHAAIDNRQKFSFGLMTVYPYDEANPSPSDDGTSMSYPLYLHELMQDAADPMNHGATDWNSADAGWWLPNYNSEHYLDRLDALHAALHDWLVTGSYNGVAYRDVIGYIDIRGFGSWGEWHHYPFVSSASEPDGTPGSWPVGMRPTIATLQRIVDGYVDNYPDFQLAAMVAAFDAEWFGNTWNPPEIAQYILDAENDVGKIGWRRDQWASDADYLHDYLENNDRSAPGGPPLHLAIMERWKHAPILGEPECSGTDMALLPEQVTFYHASMVGNSNYCTAVFPELEENIREASRRMGYRIVLTDGAAPTSAKVGQTIPISLAWQNVGIAPTYEHWDVMFELQEPASGDVVWSAESSHELRLFLPADEAVVIGDMIALPADVAVGEYRLVVKVVDPTGYRAPLPLAIEGRNADGSYTLAETFTVSPCESC